VIKQDLLENQVKYSYLAIGSNLGNKIAYINKAKFELQKNRIQIICFSSNFESNSWPNISHPKFINIVVKIKTDLKPLELLRTCNKIEKKLGRKRSFKNAPRTCDIDIIDFKQKILNLDNNRLTLPHPQLEKRSFVLLPLFDINKSWKHPITKKKIVDLIRSLSIKNLTSIKQM
jgi:2-amino-4-hydroxy-6-hydroxymethyldihydropteridine diphosphokinase